MLQREFGIYTESCINKNCAEPCEDEKIEVALSSNRLPAKNAIESLREIIQNKSQKNVTTEQVKEGYAAISIFFETMSIQVFYIRFHVISLKAANYKVNCLRTN